MNKVLLWIPILLLGLPWSTTARGDEAGVREFLATYVAAFNKQDAKAIADMWAENATHVDRETGDRTEGRDAIVADIAAIFKTSPETRLSGKVDRIRFVTPDVASIEGQTSFGASEDEPEVSEFTAILTQQDGKWRINSIDEMSLPTPSSTYTALQELEWLVGHWVDEGDAVRVDTTVRWTANNAFLLRSFVAETVDGVARQGTQVIGWDPRSKEIRSWSFNSDGSFGDAVWSKNGDAWLIKSSQTLADGQAASGTYVLTEVDDDTLTLQLIGHEVDGEPQPANPAVKVVRATEEMAEEKKVPEVKKPAPVLPTRSVPKQPSRK